MSAVDRFCSVGKGRALRRRALNVVYTFGLFSAVAELSPKVLGRR